MNPTFFDLPYEVLLDFAESNLDVYKALLSSPTFCRSLTKRDIFSIKKRYTSITKDDYKIVHRLNGKVHREDDEPAIIYDNKNRHEWWINGKRHRDNDKPAMIIRRNYGLDQQWYQHGLLHRHSGDGPALIITFNQNPTEVENICVLIRQWWINGKKHRDGDEPAVIITSRNGELCEWWFQDKQHRDDDKPAVIHADGSQEWWYNGFKYLENNMFT